MHKSQDITPHKASTSKHIPARFLIVLTWIGWLIIVVAFMFWSQATHHPANHAAWYGLIIRTSVFAAWLLVVREWIAIRLKAKQEWEQ